MSTDEKKNSRNTDEIEKEESSTELQYLHHVFQDQHRPTRTGSFGDDDGAGSHYFMSDSEQSLSDSNHSRAQPRGLILLPRTEGSLSTTERSRSPNVNILNHGEDGHDDYEGENSEVAEASRRQHHPQPSTSHPTSPSNTSLSSRDCQYWSKKDSLLQFSSGSESEYIQQEYREQQVPSAVSPTFPNNKRRSTHIAHTTESDPGKTAAEAKDRKIPVAVARRSNSTSSSPTLSQQEYTNEFFRNLQLQSIGAFEVAKAEDSGDADSRATSSTVDTSTRKVDSVIRREGAVQRMVPRYLAKETSNSNSNRKEVDALDMVLSPSPENLYLKSNDESWNKLKDSAPQMQMDCEFSIGYYNDNISHKVTQRPRKQQYNMQRRLSLQQMKENDWRSASESTLPSRHRSYSNASYSSDAADMMQPRKAHSFTQTRTPTSGVSAKSNYSSPFSWISPPADTSRSHASERMSPQSNPRGFQSESSESGFYSSDSYPGSSSESGESTMGGAMRPQCFRSRKEQTKKKVSPLQFIGKSARSFVNCYKYAPESAALDNTAKHPTFVCPRCKTRQREFFTATTAHIQDAGPTGYLAIYFFVYVIAALFIFGLQEGWAALDCVYFAVLTLTTAGLGDFVPTSDLAKVFCSIFIYFGVACIGLLLGSYLAGSLDETSRKEAKEKQATNCRNCERRRVMKEAQRIKCWSTRKANVRSMNDSAPRFPVPIVCRTERPNTIEPGVYHNLHERDKKRAKVKHGSKSITRTSPLLPSFNSRNSSLEHGFIGLDAHSVGSSGSRDEIEMSTDDHKGVNAILSSPQTPLGVIEEVFSNRKPSDKGNPSPSAYLQHSTPPPIPFSPQPPSTRNILRRQGHTRHKSLDIVDVDMPGESGSHWKLRRTLSGNFERPSAPPVTFQVPTPAYPPATTWPQNSQFADEDTPGDEESTTSSSSFSNDTTEPFNFNFNSDITESKQKTAKYIFLTLQQAISNSFMIIAVGSFGFYIIEKMSAVDSFYFTTTLLTTVGFGDIVPVTPPGKLFATIYVLLAGTVLLHNMSTISMIPLELRKQRIEKAVLTQFGDQLDDAVLHELATGPLVKRLQLSTTRRHGVLDECTREMFALAMMVRLGKVTERDIKLTFAAFRKLDVGDNGVINSHDIIVGMMRKRQANNIIHNLATDVGVDLSNHNKSKHNHLDPRQQFGQEGSSVHSSVGGAEDEPRMPHGDYYNEMYAHSQYDNEHESLLQNHSGEYNYNSVGMATARNQKAYNIGLYSPSNTPLHSSFSGSPFTGDEDVEFGRSHNRNSYPPRKLSH